MNWFTDAYITLNRHLRCCCSEIQRLTRHDAAAVTPMIGSADTHFAWHVAHFCLKSSSAESPVTKLNGDTLRCSLAFKPASKILADGDLHGVMEHWMNHGLVLPLVKLSEWRSLQLFQWFIFSPNGGMVDLLYERYPLWQQHWAYGRQKTSDAL